MLIKGTFTGAADISINALVDVQVRTCYRGRMRRPKRRRRRRRPWRQSRNRKQPFGGFRATVRHSREHADD
jgi:hypothetical protein